ncbi:hypothetical protein KBTX_00888 [wastewater metagenome]|uniref:DUF1249 domain-containing protein n=2 Tax=unclassified sequences TaxID=12908 RepID=A0A5B8R7H0_9ZZZZ|nr:MULTISPECIES: DUF1249 domain-containing protein [Arhodomonas]MCS4504385.1 DUF1249 domain-containing protein [Arhodomonas aquaeolei]QEA04580.1 hypothetical protein KBTEX_00888 [uncultured organism]
MMIETPQTVPASRGERSFAALMELYENNYIYMRRLLPEPDRNGDCVVSRVPGTPDLHLRVVERCAYTTSVVLTHHFHRGDTAEVTPDLRVRIYHDARVAEVLPDSCLSGFRRDCRGPETGSMAWRWEVNRFLNRWLRYCLGEGHSFMPVLGEPPAYRPLARRWSV